MKKLFYNKFFLSNLFVGLIVLTSFLFYSYSSGITGTTRKNGTGCDCHGISPTTSVNVSITGPQTLSPGGKATYRLSISGGPLSRAGTNIAASSGTLTVLTGSGLKKVGDELTHTSPKTPVSGVVTFDFEYTAPNSPGTVTLYANGNSVNNNGSTSGDQWNYATNFVIQVTTTSVKPELSEIKNFELKQNFPNPFNPNTTISYSLNKDGFVTLQVFDLLGKEIAVLKNEFQKAGEYEVLFDASNYDLHSGTYFYKLTLDGFSDVRKFVYLK
ncbi:MAG: T9SS type A sorting domain-containing protein [Ignavibacteria bacterium]|nr:T9SS type A sorting domain-containing protein [Ignavibacteria bacterium]